MALVPDLRTHVRGSVYGGAYYQDADLTLHAHVHDDRTVTLRLLDTMDNEIATLSLHAAAAVSAQAALASAPVDVPDVPGMTRSTTWVLGDDYGQADLHSVADELAAWLAYATGAETWDGDPDRWEY